MSKVVELQISIFKNIKNKNLKRAKTFQKILVNSKHACYLAVHRVITNQGGRTPGIDDYVPTS